MAKKRKTTKKAATVYKTNYKQIKTNHTNPTEKPWVIPGAQQG